MERLIFKLSNLVSEKAAAPTAGFHPLADSMKANVEAAVMGLASARLSQEQSEMINRHHTFIAILYTVLGCFLNALALILMKWALEKA